MSEEREMNGKIDGLEKTLLSFVHNPVTGIIILNQENPVFLNEKAVEITGYSREELLATGFIAGKLILPDDRPLFDVHLDNFAKGIKTTESAGIRILLKNGNFQRVTFFSTTVDYPEMNSLMLVFTGTPPDEAENAAKFKMGYDIFHSCFEDNPAGKLIIESHSAEILHCNSAATEIFGRNTADICGKKFNELISISREKMETEFTSVLKKEKPVIQRQVKSRGGEAMTYDIIVASIKYEKVDAFLVTMRTASVDMEKLRKTEELKNDLSLLNEAAKVLISLPDDDSIYDYTLRLLHKQHPDSIIVFNIKYPDENKVRVRNIYGLNKSLLGRAIKAIGFSPLGKTYELSERNLEILGRGKLCHYENGFEDFVSGYIPAAAVRKIVGLFGTIDIHLIGLKRGEQLFAEIQIFSTKNTGEPKKHFTEALSQLSSEVLHRKHLEKNLVDSENKFRGFVEQSTDGILILDDKGTVVYLNKAFERITGYRKEEVEGQFLWAFVASIFPESDIKEHNWFRDGFKKALEEDKNRWFKRKFERILKRKDGSTGYYDITTFPVRTRAGFNSCAILRDVTEKKQAGIKLKQQARQMEELNQTKDKFFSIIAHDLKSPLGNIIGFSHILKEDIEQKNMTQARKMSDAIENSAVKVNILLENLLEWSQLQTGRIAYNPERFNITRLIMETCEIFRESAHIKKIRIDNPPLSDILVNADINMVSTVVRNLLSNAIKFTPANGRIRIRVKKNVSNVSIHINDNGSGMTEEEKGKLFRIDTSFSTRGTDNESGSGLGLILCKEFVEKNGGIIDVISRKGYGSEFYFTLPGVRQTMSMA